MIKSLATFFVNVASFVWLHNVLSFLKKYPQGWRSLTSYALGVLFTFPFYVVHITHKEKPENAYMLAFLGSGIGTSIGWMLEDTTNNA